MTGLAVLAVTLTMLALMALPYAAAWWVGRNYVGPRGRGLTQPADHSYEVRG